MFRRILAHLKRDALIEFRQQHSLYGLLLYVAATILVIYLSNENLLEAPVWNILFWTILLFVCVNAVAKSFLQESKGRMLYYYSLTSPVEFILSKLIYNTFLMLLMSGISLLLFTVFLGNPVADMTGYLFVVVLGGIGISMVFTVMSAIAAKAQQNAALIAILGLPVIIPHLMLILRLSKRDEFLTGIEAVEF